MYNELVRGFTKRTFSFWQALGFHVTPNHFSQPIPDTRQLPEKLWSDQSQIVGIDLNETGQLDLLALFAARYRSEYTRFPRHRTAVPGEYFLDNGQFLGVDAEILYSMVRHFRPRRIIEIGSGYSTCLANQAIERNSALDPKYTCELTAIDPHPRGFLKTDLRYLTRLISHPVQSVSLTEFTSLTAGDFLFIDSSHVLRVGSDVHYEFLEILPRLQPGVFVHIHDIFLPLEYPRDWVLGKAWFYNEQYILQAFLTFNDTFEVIWAGTYLHLKHPDKLAAAIPSYRPNERWENRYWLPGSFWIRKTQ